MTQYEKMTETPVPRLVIKMAIPTIISMMVTNIYNMADTAFVGQLGTSASGAVGVVFGLMTILQAFGFMFGQGAGSIVSRMLGAKDTQNAGVVASTALFCSMSMGLVISLLGFLFLHPLVMALGSTETIAPYARTYVFYILLAAPFMTAGFSMNNILRFEGKAALGMVGLAAGAVLNILLDPVLMFGLKMGIAGAGIATAFSQTLSAFILLGIFMRGKSSCKISPKLVKIDVGFIANIIATGLPSLLRQGLTSVNTVLLNSCARGFGDPAVAAMSIVSRVAFFVFSLALGIGQGYQPVGGFSYGAKKYSRMRQAFFFSFMLGEVLTAILAVCVLCNVDGIVRIFRNDPAVVAIAHRAMVLYIASQLCIPFCTITEMTLQCAGWKAKASLLAAFKSGIFYIPALLILTFFRGLSGIQEAQPLAYLLAMIPSFYMAARFFGALPKEDGEEPAKTS